MSTNEKKSSHAGDPKIRTNGVYVFDTSRTIVDIQPNGEWMVSAGQPSNPPPKVTTAHDPGGNGFNIEFDAGRQGTSAVADSFDTLCGGASNEWCGHSFDSSPSELNFYFGLNLSLKSGASTAEVTVYLAQGSHEVNNWGSVERPFLTILAYSKPTSVENPSRFQSSPSETTNLILVSRTPIRRFYRRRVCVVGR